MTIAEDACNAMREATQPYFDNEDMGIIHGYQPDPLLFWPSMLEHVDKEIGGYYGVATTVATGGAGKSLLALSGAIEAAASGEWQVIHFSGEDDRSGVQERFNTYLNANPGAQDCIPNITFFSVGKGVGTREIAHDAMHAVNRDIDTPVLTVLDSVNSIVELSGRNYLQELHELSMWCALARRLSGAKASFHCVSEANKAGNSKGEKLTYKSDIWVKLTKRGRSGVKAKVGKTRRTAGDGIEGLYIRDAATGRFVLNDRAKLRAVEEDEQQEMVL